LAWIWPIISPPDDYVKEAERARSIIRDRALINVRTLLDLGCGAGHIDNTLKRYFEVTGADISSEMLGLAKSLNPEVTYMLGDMRTVKLEKTFDAVAVFDSIAYMLNAEDLRAAFETAFHHLKPGGVFYTYVEESLESFRQGKTRISNHSRDDVEITFIENLYDPDPEDTTYEVTFVYLIRRRGRLDIETDRHLSGIFSMRTWLDSLRDVGFEVRMLNSKPSDSEAETIPELIGVRPL